jgi:drug/metabolite transporter (DMT)-like permease
VSLEPLPFAAILLSALLHAGWNAWARAQPHPGDVVATAVMAAGVVALPLVAIAGLPAPVAWPWLAVGVVINSLGIRAAMAAYGRMSYGLAYPIMRAGIPLLALPIGFVLFQEAPSLGAGFGVLLISGALILLALIARHAGKGESAGVGYALAAALCGAGYVAVDAKGVRLSDNPMGYAAFVAIGNGLVLAAMVRLEGRSPLALLRKHAPISFGISVLSMTSFLLFVWALQVAPVALAAALRETSVLFAVAIAALVLKERIVPLHWLAAGLALVGVACIRLL